MPANANSITSGSTAAAEEKVAERGRREKWMNDGRCSHIYFLDELFLINLRAGLDERKAFVVVGSGKRGRQAWTLCTHIVISVVADTKHTNTFIWQTWTTNGEHVFRIHLMTAIVRLLESHSKQQREREVIKLYAERRCAHNANADRTIRTKANELCVRRRKEKNKIHIIFFFEKSEMIKQNYRRAYGNYAKRFEFELVCCLINLSPLDFCTFYLLKIGNRQRPHWTAESVGVNIW